MRYIIICQNEFMVDFMQRVLSRKDNLLYVVSKKKLAEKKPLEIAELVKSDEMSLIYTHLFSLMNFNALVRRFSEK